MALGMAAVWSATVGPTMVPTAFGAVSTGPDQLWVSYEGTPAGRPFTGFTNAGTASVDISLVTAHHGAIVSRSSPFAGSHAADFPAYDGSPRGARAVIGVVPTGSVDDLEPLSSPFTLGADARLDASSEGSASDNGNNLLQRGLYLDAAQYKLQIDHGTISCRVEGASGAAMVASRVHVKAGTWYRIRCDRVVLDTGDQLVLRVRTIGRGGRLGAIKRSQSKPGAIGDVDLPDGTPLSIGGKLDDDLTIAAATDQFNGLLDNTYLRVS